ncbi:MAG: hypothetical protein HKN67_11380, partial [Saprospiraceae bacterium]|nr:hypothetical protein [Saprospiraceae bacterium]
FRVMNDEQLNNWKFGNKHNVYVVLHDLACDPSKYRAVIEEELLAFYRDSIFVSRFGLDDQLRPHLFYAPNPDGSVSGSRFTILGTDDGLVHSDGGHPLDSSFMYVTEIWKPTFKTK